MNRRGFTMIEVLVAIMVFAVGICAAVSVTYVASHWGTKTRAEMEASRLARALYDYARRIEPPAGSILSSPDSAFDYEYPGDTEYCFRSPMQLVWKVKVEGGGAPLNLRLLTITVSHDTEGNGNFDPYVISPEGGDEPVAVFHAQIR